MSSARRSGHKWRRVCPRRSKEDHTRPSFPFAAPHGSVSLPSAARSQLSSVRHHFNGDFCARAKCRALTGLLFAAAQRDTGAAGACQYECGGAGPAVTGGARSWSADTPSRSRSALNHAAIFEEEALRIASLHPFRCRINHGPVFNINHSMRDIASSRGPDHFADRSRRRRQDECRRLSESRRLVFSC